MNYEINSKECACGKWPIKGKYPVKHQKGNQSLLTRPHFFLAILQWVRLHIQFSSGAKLERSSRRKESWYVPDGIHMIRTLCSCFVHGIVPDWFLSTSSKRTNKCASLNYRESPPILFDTFWNGHWPRNLQQALHRQRYWVRAREEEEWKPGLDLCLERIPEVSYILIAKPYSNVNFWYSSLPPPFLGEMCCAASKGKQQLTEQKRSIFHWMGDVWHICYLAPGVAGRQHLK